MNNNQIAHEIMGLRWHEVVATEQKAFSGHSTCSCGRRSDAKLQFSDLCKNPNYETNIADAWKLLEWAKQNKGEDFYFLTQWTGTRYLATFLLTDHCLADTVPAAIVAAFLAAFKES